MPRFTTFNTDSMLDATRGIRQYVACYSDAEYPDEMLSAEQVTLLARAVTTLEAFLASEGISPARIRGGL